MEKGKAMILDMSVVTIVVVGVVMLITTLSRIWRDEAMEFPKADKGDARKIAPRSTAIDNVGKENSLA